MSEGIIIGMQSIMTIMLLIVVGFILKKRNIVTQTLQEGMTTLLIRVIFPFTILASFLTPFDGEKFRNAAIFLLLGIIYYPVVQLIMMPIIYRVYPKGKDKKTLFIIASTYPNALFMGYPFVQAIFGNVGLFYASIYNLSFNLYLWSMGYARVSGVQLNKKGIKEIILNPIILACLFGLGWWILASQLPASMDIALLPIYQMTRQLGSVSTPLSMIIVGGMLADSNLKSAFSDIEVWFFTLIKLIVLPAIVFVVLKLIGLNGMQLGIPVIIAAMPMGATVSIMTAKHQIGTESSPAMITLSTLLSMLTITMWLFILFT